MFKLIRKGGKHSRLSIICQEYGSQYTFRSFLLLSFSFLLSCCLVSKIIKTCAHTPTCTPLVA
jgi:hypothetical protein